MGRGQAVEADTSGPAGKREAFPDPQSAGMPGSTVMTWAAVLHPEGRTPACSQAPARAQGSPGPQPQLAAAPRELPSHQLKRGGIPICPQLPPALWNVQPRLHLPTTAGMMTVATPDGLLLPSL